MSVLGFVGWVLMITPLATFAMASRIRNCSLVRCSDCRHSRPPMKPAARSSGDRDSPAGSTRFDLPAGISRVSGAQLRNDALGMSAPCR